MWIAALLLTGAVGGAAIMYPTRIAADPSDVQASNDESDSDSTAAEQGLSLIPESVPEPVLMSGPQFDSLKTGDRFLLGGNYVGAYNQYSKLLADSSTQEGSLLIRLGLASERAGFLNKASGHYYYAIESPNGNTLHRFQGLMGTARILESQDRFDDAIDMLSELYLVYGVNRAAEDVAIAVHSQLANCLQKRNIAMQPNADSMLPLEYAWLEMPIESIIADDIQMPMIDHAGNARSDLKVIQNPTGDLALTLVDADMSRTPCLQLGTQLESATGVSFVISPDAHAALSGRFVRINAKGMSVAILMDQAFGRQNLIWNQTPKGVEIRHKTETTEEERLRFESGRIQRLLEQMRFLLTDERQRALALMNAASNSVLAGDVDDAVSKLEAAQQLAPTDELSAMLFFNLGQVALIRMDHETALRRFYQTLDQTLTTRLQSKAYGMIASIELQLGRPDKAIVAAARALHMTSVHEQSAHNLMVLAKAYLLHSDPMSASRILHEHADLITDESSKRLASVLSTYARFQITQPKIGLQNEGERLILALAGLQRDDPKTFVDHALVSRAFDAAGFHSKALDHLSLASQSSVGQKWPVQIRFELIDMHLRATDYPAAVEVLKQIPSQADPTLETKRLFLTADLQLKQGFPDQCVQTCQQILQSSLRSNQQRRALELMGRSYRELEQHYAAALCFAGLMPETTAESSDFSRDPVQ